MPHIDWIKAYESSEEPDVCLCELGTSQVNASFPGFLHTEKDQSDQFGILPYRFDQLNNQDSPEADFTRGRRWGEA